MCSRPSGTACMPSSHADAQAALAGRQRVEEHPKERLREGTGPPSRVGTVQPPRAPCPGPAECLPRQTQLPGGSARGYNSNYSRGLPGLDCSALGRHLFYLGWPLRKTGEQERCHVPLLHFIPSCPRHRSAPSARLPSPQLNHLPHHAVWLPSSCPAVGCRSLPFCMFLMAQVKRGRALSRGTSVPPVYHPALQVPSAAEQQSRGSGW